MPSITDISFCRTKIGYEYLQRVKVIEGKVKEIVVDDEDFLEVHESFSQLWYCNSFVKKK